MEGSLGALCVAQRRLQSICLNPCSNGRYSRSRGNETVTVSSIRLNPCSNGRYSQRSGLSSYDLIRRVLILVLMEDTLRVWVIKLADH